MENTPQHYWNHLLKTNLEQILDHTVAQNYHLQECNTYSALLLYGYPTKMTAIKGEGNNISEIDNTEHIRNIVSPQYILNPCHETETRKENMAKGVTNTRKKREKIESH